MATSKSTGESKDKAAPKKASGPKLTPPQFTMLEAIAKMAFMTLLINPQSGVSDALLDRHYFRKHGTNSTYGQK